MNPKNLCKRKIIVINKIRQSEVKYTIFISCIVSVVLFVLSAIILYLIKPKLWTWSLSLLIGQVASTICYLKSSISIGNMLYSKHPKGMMVTNYATNMLIYAVVLVVSQLVGSLNIFFCLAGLLIERVVIVILYGVIPARRGGDKL